MATLTFGAKIGDSCQYCCETDNCPRKPTALHGEAARYSPPTTASATIHCQNLFTKEVTKHLSG